MLCIGPNMPCIVVTQAVYKDMEHRRAAHVQPISGSEGAKAVQEQHPAVIPRLSFSVADMWTPERTAEQKNRQDALRLFIKS